MIFRIAPTLLSVALLMSAVHGAEDALAPLRTWDLPQGGTVAQTVIGTANRASSADQTSLAGRLAAVLTDPSASVAAKGIACDALVPVATTAEIPALAAVLTDPVLSPRARAVLLQLPEGAVLPVLRTALASASGRTAAGLASDLGRRHDRETVPALARLAAGDDLDLARAAITALGDIGDPQALAALRALPDLPTTADARRDALLAIAQRLMAGDAIQAGELARSLTTSGLPAATRAAAWRVVLDANPSLIPQAVGLLTDADARFADTLVEVLAQVRGPDAEKAITAGLTDLPGAARMRVLSVLQRRSATAAAAAVAALAGDADATVRAASMRCLGAIGGPDQLTLLCAATTDPDPAVATAAWQALARCPHPDLLGVITARLGTASGAEREALLHAGCHRRLAVAYAGAIPLAGRPGAAGDRFADILATTAGPAELPALAAALAASGDRRMERLWATLIKRQSAAPAADALIAVLPQVTADSRAAVLRTLALTAAPAALTTVVMRTTDPDPATRNDAVRALTGWPTIDATAPLLEIAKTSAEKTHRILALRALARLSEVDRTPTPKRLEIVQAALVAAGPADEAQILPAIGRIPSPAALDLLIPCLDRPELRETALTASFALAETLTAQRRPDDAKAVLTRISASTTGADRERAQTMLTALQAKAK